MLSVPTDTDEIMVLGTSFVSILHEKVKTHPQVSTNRNTIKYLMEVTI